MGSLDIKKDQEVLEPEPEIASNESESMVDSPTTFDKNDILELMSEPTSSSDSNVDELIVHSPPAISEEEKASCSSSSMSSTDFTLEDPFHDSGSEHVEKSDKGNDYAIESPRIQVMECPTTDEHRIPSSVFARRESTNYPGWGMASNESLFSISIRGMSFRNQDSLVSRYGDLDLGYSIEPSPCGTPIEIDMILEMDETSPTRESDSLDENLEVDQNQEMEEAGRSHKLGKEDKIQSLCEISINHGSIITNEPVKTKANLEYEVNESVVEELKPHFAAESGGDRSSFAFPILTADSNKGYSARINGSAKAKPIPQLETQPNSEVHAEPGKQAHPFGPKADTPSTSWRKCFGCCTNC